MPLELVNDKQVTSRERQVGGAAVAKAWGGVGARAMLAEVGRGLTVTEILEEALLAREIQLHPDADGEGGDLSRLQRKLGKGLFQLPAQEVAIQFFCNDHNSDGDVTKAIRELPVP